VPAYQYSNAALKSFEDALSRARLDTYLRHARSKNPHASLGDALDLYIWNLQVSAALHGPLHVLEVCLRNALHRHLSLGFTSDWVDDPAFVHVCIRAQYPVPQPGQKSSPAGPDLLRDIYKVRNRVARSLARKNAHAVRRGQQPHKATVTINDIVAGLDFGFWTMLLDSQYEQTLWRTTLYHAFPHYSRISGLPLNRAPIASRFNGLRDLRNRVMHHEPLFERNLNRDFATVAETIAWMFDDVGPWIDHHSRWPVIQATQSSRPETF
jgi:Abi-like protein